MNSDKKRIEWGEIRRHPEDGLEVAFRVIAEQRDGQWRFYEKEPCEIRWFDLPDTPELIAKAEILLQAQSV